MKDCKTLLKLYKFTHFIRMFFKRDKITWVFVLFLFNSDQSKQSSPCAEHITNNHVWIQRMSQSLSVSKETSE